MTATVTIGWWAIPAVITIISFAWAIFTPAEPSSGWFPDMRPLFRGVGALIASMFAWLIWALVF